ncbi:MAG: PD-(D/E)XK nuclease family protein, partial [Actinobacteria bacterium]|nr:PD-(D/E)XK nuclease family protein [Actinomycetota bacterium]
MRQALEAPPAGFLPVALKHAPYSASRLIVARCPARFMSKYILKDKIISDTLASARGSAIHEVLQKITEHRVRKEDFTPRQLDSWVHEAVGKFPAAYEQIKLVKEAAIAYTANPSPYINNTTKCEIDFAVKLFEEDSFVEDSVLETAFVKTPYYLDADSRRANPDAFFGVRIDQISVDEEIRVVTILDHKSTPSANSNSDHDFQMGCYAWIVSLYYPDYEIRTVLHYAHPRLNFYAPPVYWSREDLDEVEQEIKTRVMAIESFNNYPALPGSHCDYCHLVQECPELRTVQEQNARGDINLNIDTVDDMIRVARQLRVIGVLYDQLNRKLKESIENKCPDSGIAIEGMWYGFKASDEKVDWSSTERKIREENSRESAAGKPADLSSLLTKHGLDPESFKEWRGEKLKALWKLGKMDLIEELKSYIVTNRDTRFG